MKKLSHIEFISRIKSVGLDLKPLEQYNGRFKKILIMDELGITYLSNPDKLFEGKKPSLWTAIDKNDGFRIQSQQIHGDKYSYEFVNYIKNAIKVKILCPIHGVFEQTPSNHLSGQGCPKCGKESAKLKYAKNGFSRTQWISFCSDNNKIPSIYIIECFNGNEKFIKIGITTRKINQRFWKSNMPYNYNLVYLNTGTPEFIYDKEKSLHRQFKDYKYTPKEKFDGYRECFKHEIMKGVIP